MNHLLFIETFVLLVSVIMNSFAFPTNSLPDEKSSQREENKSNLKDSLLEPFLPDLQMLSIPGLVLGLFFPVLFIVMPSCPTALIKIDPLKIPRFVTSTQTSFLHLQTKPNNILNTSTREHLVYFCKTIPSTFLTVLYHYSLLLFKLKTGE